jgi:thiol-disulfide isomerase/thioredoxin
MSPAPHTPSPDAPLTVACLCAGWCTACQAYRATFDAVAAQFSAVRFAWIDIEAHSDALGDAALDIENFPTLMLLRGPQPLFFGTVLPHAGTLVRMVEAAQSGALAAAGLDAAARNMAPAVDRLAREARA